MFSPLRNRFGIPGVISVIALVFAMFGGAYAASNNSGGDATAAAKKNKKAKKGPRGPRGKTGAAGPAGPMGPAGPAGAKGDTGAAGAAGEKGATGSQGIQGTAGNTGSQGIQGTAGKSVVVGTENTGTANCEGRGGASVEKEGSGVKAYACTGKEGVAGPEGPTCPGGQCILPEGATLTGVWNFRAINVAKASISISYPLRIPGGLTFHYVKYEEQGTVNAPPQCPSPLPSEPEAAPGHLCVYETEEGSEQALSNASVPVVAFGLTDYSSGMPLNFTLTNPANEARGGGSWAATR